jgi:pimeloyl-ACP methyl ester carboxylesterase
MMARKHISLMVFVLTLAACASVKTGPYGPFETKHHEHGTYYLFGQSESKSLIIYLEGSGMNSVLGVKSGRHWKSVQFTYFVTNAYQDRFVVLVPEKLTMKPGCDYGTDSAIRSAYAVDNLVQSYVESIDHYLSTTHYDHVYLFGVSEGGLLLPAVYNQLAEKPEIDKIVIWGAGGLNQYECFKILADSPVWMPDGYRALCAQVEQERKNIDQNPDSIEKSYLGWPYRRWSSFFVYNPIEELALIDIPVFFVQGNVDWNSPVESVHRVQESLPNKPFTYRYIAEMGHFPDDESVIFSLLNEIAGWLQL